MKKVLSAIVSCALLLSTAAVVPAAADDNAAVAAVSVGLGSATRIEFEDYVSLFSFMRATDSGSYPEYATVKTSDECSGGKFIHFDTNPEATNDTEAFSIPINVKETGSYSFKFLYAGGVSDFNLFLDSTDSTAISSSVIYSGAKTTTSTTAEDGTTTETSYYTYFNDQTWAQPVIRATSAVEITAGEHDLIVRLSKRTASTLLDYAGCLDYIDIIPASVKISPNSTTTVEFENYLSSFSPQKPTVGLHTSAGGGACLYSGNLGTEAVTLDIPVTVEKSGKYQVTAGIGSISYLSTVSLMSGANTLYTFSSDKVHPQLYSVESIYTVHKFTFTAELRASMDSLTISIPPRTGSWNTVACAVDYISLTPQDTLTVEYGVATASVSFDTAVSGKAIVALYNSSKELIGINYKDLAGAEYVIIDTNVLENEAVDTAKVMVWDNLTNCTPVIKAKELSAS